MGCSTLSLWLRGPHLSQPDENATALLDSEVSKRWISLDPALILGDGGSLRQPFHTVEGAGSVVRKVIAFGLRTIGIRPSCAHLPVAYAANYQFDEAIAAAERGAPLAEGGGKDAQAAELRRSISNFERNKSRMVKIIYLCSGLV
jgi:hypothetical protein